MEKKISLITVCFNRLHHLKLTLLQNIKDNEEYGNMEFVILDHNSADGIEYWISAECSELLTSGRLKYFRTKGESAYHHARLSNLAFSLASGDILCNIEANYFTGSSFVQFVNQTFLSNKNIMITPIDFFNVNLAYYVSADLFALCCVTKTDFRKVRGFDESMNNYGFEYIDLVNRLEMTGVKRYFPINVSNFKYIASKKEERYSIADALRKISKVFVAYREQAKSEWIILYVDGSYERFYLVDKYALESQFFVNSYMANYNRYQLYLEGAQFATGGWEAPDESFFEVKNEEVISRLIDFRFTFHSRSIMEQNLKNRNIVPNRNSYGQVDVLDLSR